MVSTSKPDTASPSMPQVGMLTTLRNRRALIAVGRPYFRKQFTAAQRQQPADLTYRGVRYTR